MRISDVHLAPLSGGFRASARIQGPKGLDGELWYEVGGDPALPAAEMVASAFLAACLPVAVWHEDDLWVDDPVDAEFLFHVQGLARAHARLHSRKRASVIHASGASTEPPPGRVVGSSFSGGVDSFYTIRTNQNGPTPVGAIVTGLGLDTGVEDREGHALLMERFSRVSGELGLAHYGIRTNFREVFHPYACGTLVSQGACLVAFAFLLSGSLHTYLIPSCAAIDFLYPYSSHALLDGAWISRHLRTVSDGWDRHRNEKLSQIADWPLAMEVLRVCHRHGGRVNCGRCEKCCRTIALLALAGINNPPSFPHPLGPEHLAHLKIRIPLRLYWWRRIREQAREQPEFAWMVRSINVLVWKTNMRRPANALRRWKERDKYPLRK